MLRSFVSRTPTNAKKQYDGDTHFCYNMTILIGCSAQVTTRAGEKYEGIFVAYSAAQEVMLEAAHLVVQDDEECAISTHYDVLIIPTDKVLAVFFEDVDLSYPTRDFQTDAGITASSSLRNFSLGDKELTPWDGPDGDGTADDSDLDCSITENGWEPQEMFRKNEERYGVVSSYNNDLTGYTIQLDKTDPEAFRKHEEQAALVALEIEKNSFSVERSKLENGDDEEEAFSAVVRPRNNINLNNNNTAPSTGNDKYIPPSKRQHTIQHNAHSTPPLMVHNNHPMNNNGVLHMSANNVNNRKPVHLANSRNSFGPVPNNIYHQNQERRSFDTRRSPHTNQYVPGNNNDAHARRLDDGNRPGRIVRPTLERKGREDTAKTNKELMEFHSTFNLQSDHPQIRRIAPNQNSPKPGLNILTTSPSGGGVNTHRGGMTSGRNMSPGSSPVTHTPPNRPKKDDLPSVPPLVQASVLQKTSQTKAETSGECERTSPNSNGLAPESSGPSPPAPLSTEPKSLVSTVSTESAPGTEVEDHGKESDSASKKFTFTFNPNAKEFNPSSSAKSFSSRSPGTPPRAPSTPTSAPQITQPVTGHSYVPLPMPQTLLFTPQYAQAPLTPSSNTTSSSVSNPPRHPNQRKGVMSVSQRSDMSPSLQMSTAGPPLLAPTTLQTSGQHTPYFSLPGAYSQVRIHPQNMVSLYSSEGNVGTQMHLPMHYLPHSGSTPPNTQNQHNSSQAGNQGGTISTGQSSGHGYGSTNVGHGGPHHVGYPIVGLPVVGVSYQHSPYMNMNMIVPHVSHQGSGAILPHSQ